MGDRSGFYGTRTEKNGFAVALDTTATGVKLMAFLILKERNGQLGVCHALNVPANACLQVSANTRLIRKLFNTWLRTVVRHDDHHQLLVLGQYHSHAIRETVNIASNKCNASVTLIPGGCTSIAQPMDHSINNPLKDSVKNLRAHGCHEDC